MDVLWRKSFTKNVKIINHNSIILNIVIGHEKGNFCFVNVFMPYQCDVNLEQYMQCLGNLYAIMEEADTSKLLL